LGFRYSNFGFKASYFWTLCDRVNYASYYWDATPRVSSFSEDGSCPLLDDQRLSGIDDFGPLHSVQFPELRDTHIMSPRDLGQVITLPDHINGPDRFPEILLKDIFFPFGDSDPIATAGEVELSNLGVEFLNDLEIGLRRVGNGL
jgi:hypothetical protein